IGLLIARDVSFKLQQSIANLRWAYFGIALTFVAMGVVAGLESGKIPFVTHIRPAPAIIQFYVVMVLAGIVVGTLTVLRRMRVAQLLAAIVLPAFLIFGTADLWKLDEGVSARHAAVRANRCFPQDQIESAATYKLPRSAKFALSFYFQRELTEWSPPGGRRTIIFTPH